MIGIFIILVVILTPAILVYLNLHHPGFPNMVWFDFFVIITMIERLWETFYTPRGKDVRKFHGDWSLLATIIGYYVTSIILVIKFFDNPIKNYFLVVFGLFVFFSAYFIRIWAVIKLGSQWNIHLVHDFKLNSKPILISTGPYKFIRHPIYLAAILELFGLMFISNAYAFIILIIFFNTPLYIWRSMFEEKQNLLKFSDEYRLYIKKVSFMIPYKFLYNHKKSN